MKKMHF